MDEERTRILHMVAEGKITAEEGVSLLEAVAPEPRSGPSVHEIPDMPTMPDMPEMPTMPNMPRHGGIRPPSRKSLVIRVEDADDTKVNLRIPLGLARAAGKFIPRQAQAHLNDYDINIKELLEDLDGSSFEGGPLVDIQDADTRVIIAVE